MATVDELITDARTFAASANTNAIALINSAQSAITAVISGPYVSSGPTIPGAPLTVIDETVPEFQPPTVEVGTVPAEPTNFISIGDIDFGSEPTDTLTPPTFVDPTKPAALRNFDLAPPDVQTAFDFPALPPELENINIPAPTLADHVEPDKPLVQIPVFQGIAPTDDISPPTDYVEQFETAYATIAPSMRAALDGQMDTLLARYNPRYHEQLAALEDRLDTYLAGGTALTPAIENQIAERARSKVNAEYGRVHKTIYGDAARRGFTIPDGALFAGLQAARQDGANNIAAAAAEIAVKQAELEQQNLQFAVKMTQELRTAVMNAAVSYHGSLVSLNGQALEYAKAVLNAMVEVYNSLVKAFTAKMELYKTEAVVFEARVRGALAVIEIYKAEIAALEAMVNVDLAKVTLYKARIESLSLLANVYKTKVDAIVSQASLEKMKIDLFGAQVQAFGVEASAKSAEWQGYSAAIGGQEAQLRAYGERVHTFIARFEAYKTRIQAKSTQLEAITSFNRNLVAQYLAEVQAYSAQVDASAKVASIQVEHNRSQLQAFQARMSAQEAVARTETEFWRTRANLVLEEFKAIIMAAVETARVSELQARGVADVAVSGAKVYEGLAGAALSGMNTLVSQSESA